VPNCAEGPYNTTLEEETTASRPRPIKESVMGYTTSFKGEFRCRRTDIPPTIASFLDSIETDEKLIGVLADWLADHQDGRAGRVQFCRTFQQVNAVFHGLAVEHAAYLHRFSRTRRMTRDPKIAEALPDPFRLAAVLPVGPAAGYFVGSAGYFGQDHDPSVLDSNTPPKGQPGLWCQWVPSDDWTAIVWSGGEKFYDYVPWLKYLIENFLGPWGYHLDGQMKWQGEAAEDRGVIEVRDNTVCARRS